MTYKYTEAQLTANQQAWLRNKMRGIEASPPTVKRPDLFGNVNDTYATEGELNGYRQEQGKLF